MVTGVVLRAALLSTEPWPKWLLLSALEVLHGRKPPALDSAMLQLLTSSDSPNLTPDKSKLKTKSDSLTNGKINNLNDNINDVNCTRLTKSPAPSSEASNFLPHDSILQLSLSRTSIDIESNFINTSATESNIKDKIVSQSTDTTQSSILSQPNLQSMISICSNSSSSPTNSTIKKSGSRVNNINDGNNIELVSEVPGPKLCLNCLKESYIPFSKISRSTQTMELIKWKVHAISGLKSSIPSANKKSLEKKTVEGMHLFHGRPLNQTMDKIAALIPLNAVEGLKDFISDPRLHAL